MNTNETSTKTFDEVDARVDAQQKAKQEFLDYVLAKAAAYFDEAIEVEDDVTAQSVTDRFEDFLLYSA